MTLVLLELSPVRATGMLCSFFISTHQLFQPAFSRCHVVEQRGREQLSKGQAGGQDHFTLMVKQGL